MTHKKTAKDRDEMLVEADCALEHLSPHEEMVLRLRFGIGGKRRSTTEIARHFGLRTADVRSLEARALTHLRQHALAREGLRV